MDRNYHPNTRPHPTWFLPFNLEDHGGYITSKAKRSRGQDNMSSPNASNSGNGRSYTPSPSPYPPSEHESPVDGDRADAFLHSMDSSLQQDVECFSDAAAISSLSLVGTNDHVLSSINGSFRTQHGAMSSNAPIETRSTGQGSTLITVTETSDTHSNVHILRLQGSHARQIGKFGPSLLSGISDFALAGTHQNLQHLPPSPSVPVTSHARYLTEPYLDGPVNTGFYSFNSKHSHHGNQDQWMGLASQDSIAPINDYQHIFEPRPVDNQHNFNIEKLFLKCLNNYIAQQWPASLTKPESFINLDDIRVNIRAAVLDKCPALGQANGRCGAQIDTILSRFKKKVGTKAIRNDRDKQKSHEQTHWCPFSDCGGVFTRSFGLKNHLAAHFDIKEIICDKCNKPLRGASSTRHKARCKG